MTSIQFSVYEYLTGTVYKHKSGDTLFGPMLHIYPPHYLKRSTRTRPAFAMIMAGKHLSSFFPTPFPCWFRGDFRSKGLLIFMAPTRFELWTVPMEPSEMMKKFTSGELTDELYEARKNIEKALQF